MEVATGVVSTRSVLIGFSIDKPYRLIERPSTCVAMDDRQPVFSERREGGTWLECRLCCFFPDDAPLKDLSTARFQVVETVLSV